MSNERSLKYKLLSILFSSPWDLKELVNLLDQQTIFDDDLRRLIRELDADSMKSHYAITFGHSPNSNSPLYETMYGRDNVFTQSNELADIAGFYESWGLTIRECSERVDHISVELEFMSYLCMREAVERDKKKKELILDVERKFMSDHLGRWANIFARRVMENSSHDLFKAAAKALDEFIEKEITFLDVNPRKIRAIDVVQKSETPATSCFSCPSDCVYAEEVDLESELE